MKEQSQQVGRKKLVVTLESGRVHLHKGLNMKKKII